MINILDTKVCFVDPSIRENSKNNSNYINFWFKTKRFIVFLLKFIQTSDVLRRQPWR